MIQTSPVSASQNSSNIEHKRIGAKVSSQVEELKPVKEETKDPQISKPIGEAEKKLFEQPSQQSQIKESQESCYYMPVAALNQFNKDWCIKVRVVKKNELRTYKNARGEGCILSFDLIDADGTMIQATCFNDKAKELVNSV